MEKRIKSLVLHPLFSGSAVMIVGTNIANFIAYIYHVVMGRILGPESYGELVAILSLVIMVSSAVAFLNLVIVKFVSASKASQLQSLFSWFAKKALVFGIFIAGITFLLTPFISKFLHIDTTVIYLLVPLFFVSIITFVYQSFLQGLMRFKEIVIASNINMAGRLILGIVFVVIGYSVFGAMLGTVIAAIAVFVLVKHYLADYKIFGSEKYDVDTKEIWKYALPVFLSSVATLSFFSTDVVLVKHFFSSFDAGLYGALSTLGKVIYFGVAPVTAVMFPMVSKRYSKGSSSRKIFIISLLLATAIALAIVVLYWLFPEISIKVLFGSQYLLAASYLVWFAIFMATFTLSTLFVNYYLSQDKTKAAYLILAASIAQAIGIWIFHNSILAVIKVSIATSALLLLALVTYFVYELRKPK